MEPPVACSLEQGEAAAQLDEWRALFAASVTSVEWPEPDRVTMALRDDADVAALAALARREAACCPFFRFAIEVGNDGAAFTAVVPADARPILQSFASLAPA